MLRKAIFLLFIILAGIIEAKLPELTPKDVKIKVEDILKAHASYKKINTDIAERILKNFIDELDPTKTYLIESDIQQWLYPSDEITDQVIESFKRSNFQLFEEINQVMIQAIARRNKLEIEVDASELPQKVNPEEFKDMEWTNSNSELLTRLLRIKALQLDAADKFKEESKENFIQRINKRRLNRESEIQGKTKEEKKLLVLSNIIKACCSSLDTHTNYLTPSEATQFMIHVQQRLFGIGAQLRDDLNGFTIMRIIEGGPAEKSNLKINDRIIAVNNEPVVGMDIIDAVELIRGEKDTKVNLTLLREKKENDTSNGYEKIDIELIRGEVVLEESRIDSSYEPYGDGIIAHLRLFSFYQDPNSSSADDMKNAIDNFKKKYKLKAVILDLRSNSGGLLPQAVEVASLFISKGIVVSIKDNNGNVQHLRNTEGKITWDGPLIILTNKASASASEIVAQTLQDYGRALVVGDDHTFGKGSFQTFTLDASKNAKVNPQGEYKVTRGKYYTVSGKSPQLKGVKADIVIPGMLSELDIGEMFAKYPLENDEISSNFDDQLLDIPPAHRKRVSLLYKHNMQQKIKTYTQYLDILKNNSEKRIADNKNYQNFLTEMKNKNFEAEPVELFGQSDLQLQEAYNIIKDLVYLNEINNKNFE